MQPQYFYRAFISISMKAGWGQLEIQQNIPYEFELETWQSSSDNVCARPLFLLSIWRAGNIKHSLKVVQQDPSKLTSGFPEMGHCGMPGSKTWVLLNLFENTLVFQFSKMLPDSQNSCSVIWFRSRSSFNWALWNDSFRFLLPTVWIISH